MLISPSSIKNASINYTRNVDGYIYDHVAWVYRSHAQSLNDQQEIVEWRATGLYDS